jgi:MoaD family protein
MRVSVRFFTRLREIVGQKENLFVFSEKKITLGNVLEKMAEVYGKSFVEYVYDAEAKEVKPFLQFLINGRNASLLDGLYTELADGDVLAIIPPFGGG